MAYNSEKLFFIHVNGFIYKLFNYLKSHYLC
jgi:hypothetical protein